MLALSSQVQGVRSSEQGDVLEKWGFTEFLASLEQGWCVCALGLELNCLGVLYQRAPSMLILALLLPQSGKLGRKQGGK